MPGVFIGSTELTTVGDIKVGGVDVQEVYVGAVQIFPTGGGLTTLFDVDFENGDAIPGGATFTRATVAYYRNDSGVWVQAGSGTIRDAHNDTPGGGEKGFLQEVATVKLSLHSRDLTDPVWSATNITPALDKTGLDNVANSASTLTAAANNGTIFQSFTRGASVHAFQAFVARKTGTGTVEMTIDGGTTWVDITSSLTSILDNAFIVQQSLANPSIGFRLGTSGDEIEVDCCELEANDFASSPMVLDSGSTQTRNNDQLNTGVDPAGNPFTVWIDATGPPTIETLETAWGNTGDIDALIAALTGNRIVSTQGGIEVSKNWADTRLKASYSKENTGSGALIMSVTGATSDTGTETGSINGANLSLGRGSGGSALRGVIHRAIIYDSAVDQTTNESLVA